LVHIGFNARARAWPGKKMVSMMSAACRIQLYLGVAFNCLVEIELEDAAFDGKISISVRATT